MEHRRLDTIRRLYSHLIPRLRYQAQVTSRILHLTRKEPRKGSGRLFAAFFLLLVLITLSAFSAVTLYSLKDTRSYDPKWAELAGKAVWQGHGCVQCHTLLGHGSYLAPDLTHVTRYRSRDYIIRFLTNPGIIRPSHNGRHIGLDLSEAEDVYRYLQLIGRIENLNWPERTGYRGDYSVD